MMDTPRSEARHRRPEPFLGKHRNASDRVSPIWTWFTSPEHFRSRVAAAACAVALAVTPLTALSSSLGARADHPPPDLAAMATLTEREHAIDHTARSSTRGEIEPATEELTIVPQTSLPDLAAIGPKPSPVRAPSEPETTSAPATEPTSADRSAAEAEAAQAEPASNATPKSVRPVAGLSQTQMDHAAVVVQVGQEMGLPKQAYVVAIATVLQESYLKNLANPSYPESFDIPNDGNGTDHDSVGLFQQRPASGWGTVSECMDPEHSARSFYQQLRTVPGWEDLPVTEAAQKVQVSAFPDHYAKHESLAQQIVDALT